ncbi:MAG: hypothetical protein KDD89_17080, partial [Anaerolineales bacterium]|nr:hypothetical protein [Anaerolineales bacterium]
MKQNENVWERQSLLCHTYGKVKGNFVAPALYSQRSTPCPEFVTTKEVNTEPSFGKTKTEPMK